jgi:enoyl-CoA hydratase
MTDVNLEIDGAVARVSFSSTNGIQLLNRDVRTKLAEIIEQLHQTSTVSIVVFEATGQTFIAGADIKELKQLNPATAYESARQGQLLMSRIEQLSATTVVAIHAACAGGGCEMALACDMRLAASRAVIGLPETRIGVIPGWGGTVRAAIVLGNMAARRMILSGELLKAENAMAIGLVDAVFEEDQFRYRVQERIETLLGRGPKARARAKRVLQNLNGGNLDELYEMEAREFAACFETTEPSIGMNAFLEKTKPDWQ